VLEPEGGIQNTVTLYTDFGRSQLVFWISITARAPSRIKQTIGRTNELRSVSRNSACDFERTCLC